jgi:predicted ester cyclase
VTVTPIDARQRERREQTLRQLLDAQNRRDAGAAIACFTHPRYELVGSQHVYDGADEVRRYYDMTFWLFPDLAFEVIATHHSDEVVTAELWMRGSHLGSRPDFEATGKRFRCRVVALFQFAADDLIGVRVYYDTGTIVRQLA